MSAFICRVLSELSSLLNSIPQLNWSVIFRWPPSRFEPLPKGGAGAGQWKRHLVHASPSLRSPYEPLQGSRQQMLPSPH